LLDNSRDWAELWIGEDIALKRPVAVRVLDPTDVRASSALEGARAASAVTDARCVRVLDLSESTSTADSGTSDTDALCVIVRAWVEGTTLGELLGDAPLDPTDAADLVAEVAEVVASAHDVGLVHAWLDPQHVVVTTHGQVAVLDLGVAAVLHSHPTDGEPVDATHAMDVRSLGALLYAALTARWPLPTPTPLDSAPTTSDENPQPLPPRRVRAGVPGSLDALCRRALGEAVGGRPPFADAREVAVELRRWLAKEGLTQSDLVVRRSTPAAGRAPSPGSRRRRAIRWGVGVLIAALALGTLVIGVQVLDGLLGEPDGSPPPGPTDPFTTP
jgi:serine/threonine protein kinase